MRNQLHKCQKIVIKAGTSILAGSQGRISQRLIDRLSKQIMSLLEQQKKVALVTSGSIAFGMERSGYRQRPKTMSKLQACAAMGQGKLMNAYDRYFSSRGYETAQLLLTRDGLEKRDRFLKARQTLEELFRMRALPIVNENDTVAVDEIAFGDNDVLSVQVAHLIHADLLILLSDVDGFYLKDGSRVREVTAVQDIDQDLVSHLKDVRKERTVGGMKAKLEAARTAMKLGVPMLLVNGHDASILKKALAGEDVGTLFFQQTQGTSARKKWIAYSAARSGCLMLDEGAYQALMTGKKSLLPSGIKKVTGVFETGAVVELATEKGDIFGRGVVRYAQRDLQKIKGRKTGDIEGVLGYTGKPEVIHRNDMVLWS